MLKKIIRSIVFIIMVFIPLFVYANDYTSEADAASYYITRNAFKDTYYRYLLDGNNQVINFGYSGNSVTSSPGFKYGGLLSRDEYILSKGNRGSWIYNGSSFWTLTGTGSSHYTISYEGDKLINDSDTSYRARATEYIKYDVKVSGTGSVNDPWIFEQMYKVTVETNPERGTVDETTNNVYKVGRCVRPECTANVKVEPKAGLIYISNDCDGNYNTGTNILTVSNLTRDTKCNVLFSDGLYKLNIVDDGTGVEPKEVYVKYGENFYRSDNKTIINKLDTNPVKAGYEFRGYNYTQPKTNELILVIDRNGKFVDETKKKIISDGDLKIDWNAITYTVTFNPNGGSVNKLTKEVKYDGPYGELPLPTRVGYTFNGWIDEYNRPVGTSTILKIPKNHTLKATWKANTYSISYRLENGTHGASHPTSATYDTAFTLNTPTKSLKLTFSTTGTKASIDYTGAGVSGNNQSKPYTFNGWNISGMDTVTHYFGSTTSTATSVSGRKETSYKNLRSTSGTVTFNAKWAKVSVKLPKVGATGYSCKWTSDQYTWASGATYETSADNGTTARTFNASCTAGTFTVDYNPNGGSGNMTSHTCTYDQACTLKSNSYTRTGYTFTGWKKDNSGTTYSAGGSIKNIIVSGTATFFAQWSANTFTVAYNANGGSGTTSSHTCSYDGACTLKSSGYKRAGYQFAGWKKSNSGSTLSAGANIKNAVTSGTVTYYAQWTQCGAGTFASSQDDKCRNCPSDQWSNAGASECFSKCSKVNYTTTSTCNMKCDGGSKQRLAYSYYDSGYRCPSSDDWNGGSCNPQGCCSATTTTYGNWGGWGNCSKTCGGGVQYRYRTNTNYSNYDGRNCGTWQDSQSQSCNNHSCIVSPFNSYSCANARNCSGTCVLNYSGNCSMTGNSTNWRVLFLTSGTLSFTGQVGNIDLFLVGGGGGGAKGSGNFHGSGGGGGYTASYGNFSVGINTNYSIVVGPGGGTGSAGGNSSAFGRSVGGGAGGYTYNAGGVSHGGNGGSGGGGGGDRGGAGGSDGGNGYNGTVGWYTQPAGSGQGSSTREFWSIDHNSSAPLYSGGGGGGGYDTGGNGGSGGGAPGHGSGEFWGNHNKGFSASDNTGGGGGGGYTGGSNGGSGIVIIRNAR